MTNVKALVGLSETLCYKVTLETEGGLSNRLYVLQYLSQEQHFPIKTAYNFSVPRLSVQCTCACPGEGKEKCAPVSAECAQELNSKCVVVKSSGQTPAGCLWLGAETVSCCVFKVSPGSPGSVLQVSSFETRLKVAVSVLDLDTGQVIREEEVVTVDATDGVIVRVDEFIKLKIKLEGGDTALLPVGRYVKLKKELYQINEVQVNMLNDWDFNNLGWYKEDRDGRMVFREEDLHRAVTIRTVNCGSNVFKVDMSGNYFSMNKTEFRLAESVVKVGEYFASHIATVKVEQREVRVTALNSRRISVEWVVFDTPLLDAVWLYDESRLEDFTASIELDEHGNNLLYLDLRGAVGQVVGYIEGSHEEDLVVNIPGGHTDTYFTRQGVITVCSNGTRVCLKASGERRQYKCRHPVCTKELGRGFTVPKSHNLDHVTLEEWSYLRMGTWYQVGHPGNWFDRDYRVGETITAVLYILVLFIVCRVGLKMIQCLKSRRGRNEYEGIVVGKSKISDSSGEDLEVFTNFKKVGYSKSLEEYLNDGYISEDWSSPYLDRRHSSL